MKNLNIISIYDTPVSWHYVKMFIVCAHNDWLIPNEDYRQGSWEEHSGVKNNNVFYRKLRE